MASSPASLLPASNATAAMSSNTTVPFQAAAGADAATAGAIPLFPFFAPSFDLALTGSLVALFLTIIHTYLVFKTRAFYFGLAAQAVLMLAGGLIVKLVIILLLDSQINLLMLFSASALLLQIPGSLVPISIIFTYTRLMWWITPREHRNTATLWVPPMYHSLTIAGAQTFADIMGMLGTGQIIKPPIPKLVSSGAILEMLVWLYLAVLIFRFTFLSRQWPMEKAVRVRSYEFGLALTVQAVLLASRGIFQVLVKDATTALQTTFMPISIVTTEEWPVYVFDILPLIVIVAIQAIWHPGLYLPRRLTGFRLKRKGLLDEEDRRLEEEGNTSPASNGWIISQPSPLVSEKMSGMESKYMEIMEERKRYEPKYVGYAR